jgi:hypothetical protein
MELLGDVGHVDIVSVCLGTVLVSVQDRCTVCAIHTIGSEIVLDFLGDMGLVESRFGPFRDSVSVGGR